MFPGHRLQGVVKLALLADGRRSFGREISSAHRAGAVRRINFYGVVKLQKLFVQAFVQHCGHHLFRESLGAGEIGTSDVADEQRVAGQNPLRPI